MVSFPFAEDFHAHIFTVAECAGLRKFDFDFFQAEFFDQVLRQPFGERFDQEELAFGDEIERVFSDAFVIDGVLNAVAAGGFRNITREFHIHDDFLQDFAFPIENSDAAAGFQAFNKDLVLHGPGV